MKTEAQIKQLLELMVKTYEKGGTPLDGIEMPADAFECAETLKWVIGEPSGIDELLNQAGIELSHPAPSDLLTEAELKPIVKEFFGKYPGMFFSAMKVAEETAQAQLAALQQARPTTEQTLKAIRDIVSNKRACKGCDSFYDTYGICYDKETNDCPKASQILRLLPDEQGIKADSQKRVEGILNTLSDWCNLGCAAFDEKYPELKGIERMEEVVDSLKSREGIQ